MSELLMTFVYEQVGQLNNVVDAAFLSGLNAVRDEERNSLGRYKVEGRVCWDALRSFHGWSYRRVGMTLNQRCMPQSEAEVISPGDGGPRLDAADLGVEALADKGGREGHGLREEGGEAVTVEV